MEILDEDMQMVRNFLVSAGAPEYVKGHFENLVEQYAKETARAEELQDELDATNAERKEAESKSEDLQDRLDDIAGDGLRGALEHVRDWMHDILFLRRPVTDPRKVLRAVEDALWEHSK